jgi:flagellar basal body-associated protein FliL
MNHESRIKGFLARRWWDIVGLIFVLGIIVAPSFTFAHVAEEKGTKEETTEETSLHDNVSAMIVEPDLFPANTPLPIWFEIKDTSTQTHLTNLSPRVSIVNQQGQSLGSGQAELKGDEYLYEFTFPKPGDYQLTLTFTHEGKEHQSTFTIPVSASQSQSSRATKVYLWWTVGGAAVVVGVIWGFGLFGKSKSVKRSIILMIITLLVAIVVYSLIFTFRSGATTSGVVTCLDNGQCFWTAHIHSYYPIAICGQEYSLPVEKGSLSGPHTHEERNIAHWHDRLPYDKKTGKITETDPLLVGKFFAEIGVTLTNQAVADKKVGDSCHGQAATLKAFVNGKYTPDVVNHIWQDKEVISIFFDESTPEQIEEQLKAQPIEFPALGRG